MSEDRLHDAITRGNGASQILSDDLMTEAFKTLEASYMEAWRTSKVDQAADREKLFLAINIVGKVRDHLNSIVTNGKLAQSELDDLIKTAERKKRFGLV